MYIVTASHVTQMPLSAGIKKIITIENLLKRVFKRVLANIGKMILK
jgi:hypothetical protein